MSHAWCLLLDDDSNAGYLSAVVCLNGNSLRNDHLCVCCSKAAILLMLQRWKPNVWQQLSDLFSLRGIFVCIGRWHISEMLQEASLSTGITASHSSEFMDAKQH